MRLLTRALGATFVTGLAAVVVATPALAHKCMNASKKNQAAGVDPDKTAEAWVRENPDLVKSWVA